MKKTGIIIAGILVLSLMVGLVQAQTAELPEPGTLPDSAFYGIKRAFEAVGAVFTFGEQARVERHIRLAEKRLAEAEAIAEKEKPQYIERLSQRYEERLEKANRVASQSREERREQLTERVATATSRHLEVLDEVYDRVPEEAKESIAMAREKSMRGNQEVLRALAREDPEQSAEIAMQTAERRAERLRATANQQDNEELQKVSNEYQEYAQFGEEISAIAQQIGKDPSKVEELVAIATSRHLVVLEDVLQRVPQQAREHIQRAIDSSIQGRDWAINALQQRGMEAPEEAKASAERRGEGTGYVDAWEDDWRYYEDEIYWDDY